MKKYAVITGASTGIGAEFAKRLAKQGYTLILIARRSERMQKLTKKIHAECEIIATDLTSIQECERVYDFLADKNIEVFINNAGFGDCGPFLTADLDKELRMIQLNVQAVHFFTKRMLQKMQKTNYGYILNVASSAGLIPAGPYMAAYYASKSYITSLTRAVAEELKECKSSVYIGCLCPGPVDTEFNRVANVEFSLKGIPASYCAAYALRQMKKRRVLIIPTFQIKFVTTIGRFLPSALYIRLVSHQQKKKIYS